MYIRIDAAVLVAYGWQDIVLAHDIYSVSYLPESDRIRFTICEDARLEILRRLSLLNRERWEKEQVEGHAESGAKALARSGKQRVFRAASEAILTQQDLF